MLATQLPLISRLSNTVLLNCYLPFKSEHLYFPARGAGNAPLRLQIPLLNMFFFLKESIEFANVGAHKNISTNYYDIVMTFWISVKTFEKLNMSVHCHIAGGWFNSSSNNTQ